MSGNFWDNDPIASPVAKSAYKPTPDDNKTLTDMAKTLPTMRTLAQRAQQAAAVQGSGDNAIPTGPALAKWNLGGMDLNPVRGALAAWGGLPEGVPGAKTAANMAQRLQRMDQINSETFAMIRPDGSGRIMQSEVQPFKQSFPSTGGYGQNNADSAANFQREYGDKLRQYQFVSNYVKNGHGSAADALAAYDGLQAQPAPAANPRAAANQVMQQRSAQTRAQNDPLGIR